MQKNLNNIKTMNNLWQKTIGVIGKKNWGEEGYFFPGVNSIHTFFVSLSLDLVFIDREGVVIRTVENLKPWSFSPFVWQAKGVFELPTGTIKEKSIKIGDKINLV